MALYVLENVKLYTNIIHKYKFEFEFYQEQPTSNVIKIQPSTMWLICAYILEDKIK
jgi:hypothetical protein